MKVTVKMARPRARTQAGRASCISAVRVDVTAIQASPAQTRAARAAGKLGTTTTTACAAAYRAPPSASVPLVDRRVWTRPSTKAPMIAPTPSAPNRAP